MVSLYVLVGWVLVWGFLFPSSVVLIKKLGVFVWCVVFWRFFGWIFVVVLGFLFGCFFLISST